MNAYLKRLKRDGILEPEQFEVSLKAIKALRHALKIGDLRSVHTAITDLVKVFMRGDR